MRRRPRRAELRNCLLCFHLHGAWLDLALVVAVMVLGAFPATPHDPSQPDTEEIVVEGHYQDSVGTSEAASAGSFTHQLIADRPMLRPGEVLEFVPGLIITHTAAPERRTRTICAASTSTTAPTSRPISTACR